MGDLLVDLIAKRYHAEPLFLHGSLSRPKRDEMVTAFQDDSQNKVFIFSLKAGGTGLNLTGASTRSFVNGIFNNIQDYAA